MKERHGKNARQWAGSITKKFCQKHFDEYNNLGWLAGDDNITIVKQSECESIDRDKK